MANVRSLRMCVDAEHWGFEVHSTEVAGYFLRSYQIL
jgi:hypothetical protein